MPISARRNFAKGATVVVEAHGEVLLMPTGPVYGWSRRFANAVQRGVQSAAPVNKRPRWAHYGKPLKESITSTTPRYRQTVGGARLYAAVGSSAPYAVYVDQGTGIYGGNGPYEAKILPPTAWGAPNLYEKTWIPPGAKSPVRTVMIKGQEGQGFFQDGLRRGFASMRMRAAQVPADPKIGPAMDSFPMALADLVTSGISQAAFTMQLQEWRSWRDAAWKSRRDLLNPSQISPSVHARKVAAHIARFERKAASVERAKMLNAARQARWRERHKMNKAKNMVKPEPKLDRALASARNEMIAWLSKHPGGKISGYSATGFQWSYNGKSGTHHWHHTTADKFINAGAYKNGKYDPKLRKPKK